MASCIAAGLQRPLVRHVQLGDRASLVRVDEDRGQHVLKLLLLEERHHEDAAVVGANDGRRRVFVLEDNAGGHLLVREEEAEVARVVERLQHLRVEVDERVRYMWLALLRLRAEQGQAADVE